MSIRRYKFNITDINELAKAYPKAVTETIIPEQKVLKPNYTVIAKLLDCDIPVPGIEVTDPAPSIEQLGARELPPVVQVEEVA